MKNKMLKGNNTVLVHSELAAWNRTIGCSRMSFWRHRRLLVMSLIVNLRLYRPKRNKCLPSSRRIGLSAPL